MMTSQALMRATDFGLSSHCLKNGGKLFQNFSGSDYYGQNPLRQSRLVTSLCIRSIVSHKKVAHHFIAKKYFFNIYFNKENCFYTH